MPIQHKFIEHNFENGFATNNAILQQTPYKPEVLIIGTFNPNTPNANFADFFYGRNFLWTGFKRLLNPNYIFNNQRRMPQNGVAQEPFNPTIQEICSLCENFKLSFCDLISEVLHNGNPQFELLQNDNVIFNGQEFNLIQDNAENGFLGLANLNQLNQVHWNTQKIINYLIDNSSIRNIYLTRQPNGIWGIQWNAIVNYFINDGQRHFSNILSPSGRGNIPAINPPFNTPLNKLLHYWVWNGMNHPSEPVNNPGFGRLDHDWLQRCGVDINQF